MPIQSQLKTDKLLSNVSLKYRNTMFVADQVFPFVPVKKDSDLYRIYDRDFRLPETKRSAKGEAREYYFNVSTAAYLLEQHSLKDYVSDRDKENFEFGDLLADVTEVLTDKILLRMEKSVADLFVKANWSQNASLTTAKQWTLDSITSVPILDMDTATTTVMRQSGMEPNFAIIPHESLLAAKNNDSIVERIKYTSADITPNMIAGLFGVSQILVPKVSLDAAPYEGVAASVAALWNDNVFVGYKAPSPSIMKPSAGYIFRNEIPMVKRWRAEERQSEVVEVNMHYQARVVASLAGYLISDTNA